MWESRREYEPISISGCNCVRFYMSGLDTKAKPIESRRRLNRKGREKRTGGYHARLKSARKNKDRRGDGAKCRNGEGVLEGEYIEGVEGGWRGRDEWPKEWDLNERGLRCRHGRGQRRYADGGGWRIGACIGKHAVTTNTDGAEGAMGDAEI
ncbi:hypothetical protein C8R44DRAFT_798319 [Mycena epipterygia]|nr:hypothetical protein C8R44DRAFT_798319 [Mycena epipterygia]